MKKFGWRVISLFIIAFGTTLLLTAPATLLAGIVEAFSKGKFVLANASGTVWKGSATPAIRQRSGSFLTMGNLHWDVELLSLFTGKLVTQFRWDNVDQRQPMVATMTFKKIELRNAVFPLQAGIFGELSPVLQTAQLSGQLLITSDQFIFSKQGLVGNAVANWMNAGSVLSSVSPLGSYHINISAEGERIDATLMTLSGLLLLEGRGGFTDGQNLDFQATARATEASKGRINEFLNNLGPEISPGVHTINLMRGM